MKALKLSALGVLFASALAYAGDQAEFVTKEVTGEAAIVKGDKVAAKDQAKKAALREAVEQVAGVVIGSDQQMKNNVLVSDRVYAKSEGFIRKYDVTAEKEEAGVMKVTVKAEVGARAIDMELAQVRELVKEMGNRSVAIELQEQTVSPDGTYTSKGIFAKALSDVLKADGWKVAGVSSTNDGTLKLTAAAGQGRAEAKEINFNAADFYVLGQVGFKEIKLGANDAMLKGGEGQYIFPVEGDYDIKVVVGGNVAKEAAREQVARVEGGIRIGGAKDMVNVKQVNQIISYERTASDLARVKARMVADSLRQALTQWMLDNRNNGRTVVMSVLGIADFKAAQAFKKSIEKVNGVKEVTGGTLASGRAKYDVKFAGTTEELAEKLSSVTWNKKAVSVTGADATTMELTLK
jgi:hypothetical protein